jgi:DNA polymerase elongation subunit (family B)
MYQAIYYDYSEKAYYVRDDGFGEFKRVEYHPGYYVLDPQGNIPTLDDKRCKKVNSLSNCSYDDLYEKDVDKITRYLVDHYYKSDDPPKYHNIVYFDIEITIGGALTNDYIQKAPSEVTSIALYDATSKQHWVFILDKSKTLNPIKQSDKHVVPCFTESDLLSKFINKWEEIDPTIITGWNSGFFDVPYLYYRIKRVLGDRYANRLSPIGKVSISRYNQNQPVELGGINHLDYMLLFKKYITKQEDSYKLDEIGSKYVNLGKIEYEGNLDKLFETDVNKFIEYNVRDVDIIVELEKKLKFIELTINICHLCHVPYENIYLSTVLNDGAILTYLKRKGIISPNKPTTINRDINSVFVGDEVKVHKSLGGGIGTLIKIKEEEKKGIVKFKSGTIRAYEMGSLRRVEEYAGGYLKDPIPGLYEWIIDLDFTSLYPSIIRSLNIGLETLVGRIVNNGKYDNNWALDDMKKLDPDKVIYIQRLTDLREVKETQTTVGEIIKVIEDNNLIVAANGSLFRTDKSSIVCEVLEDWFDKRSEYKDLMKEAYKVKNDPALGEFYDKRQHAYKIKLNDVYGSYAINGWRYTDGHKFISAAITLTGQRVTQESIKFANMWLNKQLGTNKDYVITSDTDSLFVQVKQLIKHRYPNIDFTDRDKIIEIVLDIAKEIQDEANKNLDILVKSLFNIDGKHYFELKQEVVLERGYFSGKRRYAQFIVNKEGVTKEELDIKGMDLMKSNMPQMYRKFGEEILQDVLFGKSKQQIDEKIISFKKQMDVIDWVEVSKPTSLKQLNEYIKSKPPAGEIFSRLEKKCPANTKAAIYYNDLLRFKQLDIKHSPITVGEKIKWVYLKENPYKIDVIAFLSYDLPDEIKKFIDKYINREHLFDTVLRNKLNSFYQDLGWGNLNLNNHVYKFFEF